MIDSVFMFVCAHMCVYVCVLHACACVCVVGGDHSDHLHSVVVGGESEGHQRGGYGGVCVWDISPCLHQGHHCKR